ncbi:WXG100 family type VII secretion target [Nocardiopsis algeriensis]|uniref:WXG100 family type VII secretion target n=1 Tax=Nocardiopsis algeriensis TaxID=1478215 RepID=A0A841IPF4_9ACTN|nr:WXG100 family type VII secretion target [Nocardiopsis algeriensis]MBB6119146.1 WXG100 family type VII secretion target [Nocardiopsis algeriensis]
MNGFDINYGPVEDAKGMLRTQTEAVARQIEELDAQMQAVRSDLEGATAENYDAKVKSWRMNVEDMRVLLAKAEIALGQIAQNYSTTDNREAMNWSALM